MKKLEARIEILKKLSPQTYSLGFSSSYIAKVASPGQFLHIKVDNKETILRRPFSIHKVEKDKVYILFKVRGRGTKILSQRKKGDTLDIIGPLGKGFNYEPRTTNYERRIVVAGGIGVAPLIFLAEKLKGLQNIVILGAKTKDEILCESDFKKLGFKVLIATEDGSKGFKGTVPALLKNLLSTNNYQLTSNIYACGPSPMLWEINKILGNFPQINCQVCFEQFMGCGLGICCGCVIKTKGGFKKVCKEGPVFNSSDIDEKAHF